MDCEGFDEIVLDLLYDDGPSSQHLDEARRHASGCARCAGSLAALQQARQLAELPVPPVPAGLEQAILAEVERRKQAREATWWGRLDRAISLLGAFAMRPQTAMGALLVLMTGLSLVLLRAKPAKNSSVQITEHGQPEHGQPAEAPAAAAPPIVAAIERKTAELPSRKEDERAKSADLPSPPAAAIREPSEVAPTPATTTTATTTAAATPTAAPAAAPAASAQAEATVKADKSAAGESQEAAFASAMDHYKARRYREAIQAFDIVANGGGSNGGRAALYAAHSARFSSGCSAALPRYNAIANRQVGSGAASDATWEAARCYRELGQLENARQLFSTLRRVAGYRDRVEKELATLEQRNDKEPAAPAGAKPSPR